MRLPARLSLGTILGAGLLLSCAALPSAEGNAPVAPRHYLALNPAASWISQATAMTQISASDIVLLGEHHDHPVHHEVQSRVVDDWVARGRRPAVLFEMLRTDQQAAIDAVLASPSPSSDAFRAAVGWDESGWPDFALYAPVFEAALRHRLPIVAAQMPRDQSQALVRNGIDAFARDVPELAPVLGAPVPEAAAAALIDRMRSGHCGRLPESMLPRMAEVQRGWEAWMAHEIAAAVETDDVDGAIVIIGRGHTQRPLGLPFALAQLAPARSVLSVGLLEVPEPEVGPPSAALLALAAGHDLVFVAIEIERPDPCERIPEHRPKTAGEAPPAG